MGDFNFMSVLNNSSELALHNTANQILDCNETTEQYGLVLSKDPALSLSKTRGRVLKETGRIEPGESAVKKIICAFCDSVYIDSNNYEDTLHELIEIFYTYKNETLDMLSDNQLISFMKAAFDGPCRGSAELLQSKELEALSAHLKSGKTLKEFLIPSESDTENDNGQEY